MTIYIKIFVVINYSFFILYLLNKRVKSNAEKYFLSLCFSIMLMTISELLSSMHILQDDTNPNSFIGFTYGPLIWLYVKEILKDKVLSLKQGTFLLHFIPASFVLLIEILLISNILNSQFTWKIIHLSLVIQSLIYAVLIMKLLIKHKPLTLIGLKRIWIQFLGVGFFVLSIGFAIEVVFVLLDNYELFIYSNQANQIALFVFSQGILFLGFLSTNLFNPRKKYYSISSKKTNQDFIYEIESFIEQNEIYLDTELDLNSFAKQFTEKPQHISQAINSKRNQNFRDYINNFRIEKAKRLLVEEPGLSVKEVMYYSGFNSKTTFFKCFKEKVSLTPVKYRSKYLVP